MKKLLLALVVSSFPHLAHGGQTPPPTFSFNTGSAQPIRVGGDPADANVAASSTHICLTARGALACYTKGGLLVALGPGLEARPYSTADFFQSTSSSITIGPATGGDPTKDGRIVFDQKRKRFLMAFQTREEHPQLLIAASKSEDPRDGFWVYGDSVGGLAILLPPGAEWGQDYMWMGINGSSLLISDNTKSCTGTYNTTSWACSFFHTRHFIYALDQLTSNGGISRTEWLDGDADNAAPCVDDSGSSDAFWIHRDDHSHVTVWGQRNGKVTKKRVHIQSSEDPLFGQELNGPPVNYSNIIGSSPTNAECRDHRIVFVTNDGRQWQGQPYQNTVVRLVRLNVTHFFDSSPSVTVEHDVLFGRSSAGDPPGFIADYGWPAVSTNVKGDIVVGSVRSAPTIYPQLRASVWFHGQSDISGSTPLVSGVSALPDYHMAGASADPNTKGVYLAQAFGSAADGWQIHVAKMLGKVMPDIITTKVEPQDQILSPGSESVVVVTVLNQGDTVMPRSTAWIKLSTSNSINTTDGDIIAEFTVYQLLHSESRPFKVPIKIPKGISPGKYYVGVILDIKNAVPEFSETNNLNPFLADDHGNVPISIQ